MKNNENSITYLKDGWLYYKDTNERVINQIVIERDWLNKICGTYGGPFKEDK